MSPLKIEAFNPKIHQWATLGELGRGDQEGSVSDNSSNTRDIYVFGVDAEHDQGYLMKSIEGADISLGGIRAIGSEGFETVIELGPGESHEMIIEPDISDTPRKFRLTYLSEGQ